MDKIPAIFFKLVVYDARPKLAHAYYVFPLWNSDTEKSPCLPSASVERDLSSRLRPYALFFQRVIKCTSPHIFHVYVVQPVSVSHLCCISLIFRHISSMLFVSFPVYSISAVKDFVFGYKHSLHIALRSHSRHQSLMSKINLNRYTNKTEKSTFTTILVIVTRKNGNTGAIPTGGAE